MAGVGFVAAVPPVGFGKITSWKNRNRVGIDIVIPPPDDEPPGAKRTDVPLKVKCRRV
jgi:hypothetical protein